MLWSLLGALIGAWGAQFIGDCFDFAPFILNRVADGITAKLESCDWLQLQLAILRVTGRIGDANCALNLKISLWH